MGRRLRFSLLAVPLVFCLAYTSEFCLLEEEVELWAMQGRAGRAQQHPLTFKAGGGGGTGVPISMAPP